VAKRPLDVAIYAGDPTVWADRAAVIITTRAVLVIASRPSASPL
jgi:hypothetical protein